MAAALPDSRLELTADEIAPLVAAFRQTRDYYRTRLAAPVEVLRESPRRIATALHLAATDAPAEEKRRLAGDLVDLQAFVALDEHPAPQRPRPGEPPPPVLDLIMRRQASAIGFIRGDSRVAGIRNSIRGRWIAIGESDAALKATADYKDTQAAGILSMVVWFVAAPAAAIVARLLNAGTFSGATVVALIAGFFLLLWAIPARLANAIEGQVSGKPYFEAHPAIGIALVIAPIVVAPVLFGVMTVVVSGWWGLQ